MLCNRGLAAYSVMPANEASGIVGRSYGRIFLYLPKLHVLKRFILASIYGLEVLTNIQRILITSSQLVNVQFICKMSKEMRRMDCRRLTTTGIDRDLHVCVLQVIYIYIYTHTYESVCLSACLSVCLPACLPACLSVCLSVRRSVCLSVCLSVCMYACLHVYMYILNNKIDRYCIYIYIHTHTPLHR